MDASIQLLIYIVHEIQKLNRRIDKLEASLIDLLEKDQTWLYSQCLEVESSITKSVNN